jgi:hypothetical protein
MAFILLFHLCSLTEVASTMFFLLRYYTYNVFESFILFENLTMEFTRICFNLQILLLLLGHKRPQYYCILFKYKSQC